MAIRTKRADTKLTRTSKAVTPFRDGKYELLVGHLDERFEGKSRGVANFDPRAKNGVSIVLADCPFNAYVPSAKFKVQIGSVFVSSEDIDSIGFEGSTTLALKISMAEDAITRMPIPLQHVAEGVEVSRTTNHCVRAVELTRFGIPLRIVNYDFPDNGPSEVLAFLVARHAGRPTNRNVDETIRLASSAHQRALFAYGQRLFVNENDTSKGLTMAITPDTELVLNISRRPTEGETCHSSYGEIIVLEDLSPK